MELIMAKPIEADYEKKWGVNWRRIFLNDMERYMNYQEQLASCEKQVEAGYISKEEHETELYKFATECVLAAMKSGLAEHEKVVANLKANSIPKDRVREKLGNLKAEQKRRYKTGSMNWLLVERKIEMLEELLGET